MRTLWSEYGGMILGVAGAVIITGVTAKFLLPGGSVYEVLIAFSRGVC